MDRVNEHDTIEATALAWPEHAAQIAIVDQATYDEAAKLLLEITSIEKKIKAHHAPLKITAHEAHKAAIAAEKKFLEPLGRAKSLIKGEIVSWTTEQAKIKAEEERKAREEADRIEKEERSKRAVEAAKAGKSEEEVEKIIETAAPVIVKPVEDKFVKAAGVSTRKTWKAEVYNPLLLCGAIVDGKAPMACVQPDMAVLNKMARDNKDQLMIAGVRFFEDTTVATRG